MSLDASAILAAKDCLIQELEIPEWGGSVFIRVMSSADRRGMELLSERKETEHFREEMAVRVLCDKNGELLFSSADVEALGKKNSLVLDRIFDAAQGLNGMTSAAVDGLEKNLEETDSNASGSD